MMRINACSTVDTCLNSIELKGALQNDPTGLKLTQVLEDTWLSRHPKLVCIICDQGSEHCNITFKSFLFSQGIEGCPRTAKNPQSNAILEGVHGVIETSLRAEKNHQPMRKKPTQSFVVHWHWHNARHKFVFTRHEGCHQEALCPNETCCCLHPSLQTCNTLKRQAVTDKNNLAEDRCRKDHNCFVGDQMMILSFKPAAFEDQAEGSCAINQVHVNGTVSCMVNEHAINHNNIQQIKPHCQAVN